MVVGGFRPEIRGVNRPKLVQKRPKQVEITDISGKPPVLGRITYLSFGQLEPCLEDDGQAAAVVTFGGFDADEDVIQSGGRRPNGSRCRGKVCGWSRFVLVVDGGLLGQCPLENGLFLHGPAFGPHLQQTKFWSATVLLR